MDRIQYLIQRYLNREETEAELQELLSMIASDQYREIFERRFADDLRTKLESANDEVDETLQLHLEEVRSRITLATRNEKRLTSITQKKQWLRIAASILLIATFSWLFVQYYPGNVREDGVGMLPRTQRSVLSTHEVKRVSLPDGSIVWLKSNSSLSYPDSFSGDQRKVTLQGEALFEVTRDEAHPFVIACGEITTTVLGTTFNIKSAEDNIEVLVLTGKVSVHSVREPNPIVVLPNEKVVYNAIANHLTKSEAGVPDKENTIAGTDYNMKFEDTRIDEIVRRIEAKFEVKVRLSHSSLGNCIITADLTGQPLDKTLDLITQALGIEYNIKGDEVIITGTGCE